MYQDQKQYRVSQGQKPPETILHDDGKQYRPQYREITSDADRTGGEQVYVIDQLGEPVDATMTSAPPTAAGGGPGSYSIDADKQKPKEQ